MRIDLCAGATLGWLLALAGCSGFGPNTMRYQQSDYAAALADAGKRQVLLNIVKLRYGDVPSFVRVSQILAGYSVQGTFSAGTDILTGGSLRLSNDANVGVGGTFTDSPTITYAPVTGADFARTFLAPLQPADLFGLMLSGVPPELALGLGLHSIGGFDNERATPGAHTAADPRFGAVLELLIELQGRGRLKVQLAVKGEDRAATLGLGRGEKRGCTRAPAAPPAGAAGGPRDVRGGLHPGGGRARPDRDSNPVAGRRPGPAGRGHRRARRRPRRRPDLSHASARGRCRRLSPDRGAAWAA